MPAKLIAFDTHDNKSSGREAFEKSLEKVGWVNFIVRNDKYIKLPDTTLVANRTVKQTLRDIKAAQKKAKDKDDSFELKKCIVTNYSGRFAIDSDKKDADKSQIVLYRIAMSGMLP
ncbi:hypothetical protein GCM10007890_59860 [Methylobacterium tardum]|uniref:Uncharacterized protein n=1 Tax=Methylobacterium tardum TaxID=374432 RepID=A0AA37THI8_9HYPH|nr:hypothetical protein GCM10007890_59860 [Methylobacterium tardum]